MYDEPGHACSNCGFAIESDEKACEAVDSLEILKSSVPSETKSVLVYIAGYVIRKDTESDELGQTSFYFEKYRQYTNSLDRDGLKTPADRACQWTIFCFIVFNIVKDLVCRKSFSNIAMTLSEMFEFQMTEKHARSLSNIFLKNHCYAATPRSTKEPALKRLKLSESA
ncbi:group XV phospholipase a2 [Plakobranchus ocellatus]|uniref:Group XV phospholipase a2 n=1 Tax=Plakobranchus ocellatus TaxID=259542 RepID=A0AAV4CSV6_9GAST|nr:group XV phospholipase a2 [Plakobranchus ocellatus]